MALTVALLSALTVAPLSSSSQQLFSAALTVVLAVAPLSSSYSGSYSGSSQQLFSAALTAALTVALSVALMAVHDSVKLRVGFVSAQ